MTARLDQCKRAELGRGVSVLIPLYNHASTIQRALNSILLSETSRIELIVCDDASSDESYDVAQAWMERHGHRFRRSAVLKNQWNLGITGNLNRLMQLAHCEFVTMLASDDELTARAIDLQAGYLESHPDVDFVFANWGTIDQKSRVVQSRMITDRRAQCLKSKSCLMVDMVFNWSVAWGRLFARRVQFLRFGPYLTAHLLEDRWSALTIAQTRRFGYLHEVVHLYRLRAQGLGTAGLEQQQIFRDLRDVDQGMVSKSTGILRALLVVYTRAEPRAQDRVPIHRGFQVVRLGILRLHNLIAGR